MKPAIRELLGAIERVCGSEQPEARIVDHERRLELAGGELMRDPVGAVGAREIHGQDVRHAPAGAADGLGDRRELRDTPRGEHDLMAVLGENPGKRTADARRGAGDERHGPRGLAVARHPPRNRGLIHVHQ
jgi:hypothetical protein